MFCRSLNLSARWKHRSKLVFLAVVVFCISIQAANETSFLLQDAFGKTLSSLQPNRLLIPASNMKLLSLATVLHFAEPESTIKTAVWFDGKDLLILGAGDPAISSRYTKDAYIFFRKILQSLQSRKVKHLKTVSADVSLFNGPPKPTTWSTADEPFYYAADLSPLSFEDNCVKFTSQNTNGKIKSQFSTYISVIDRQKSVVGGEVIERYRQQGNVFTISSTLPVGAREMEYLSIDNPARYALFELQNFLKLNGITVDEIKIYRQSKNLDGHTLLLTHQSPPILKLVTTAMQRSNNFITEMLTWTSSAKVFQKGSWENSVKLIKQFLVAKELKGFKVDDSCGVSRENRASTKALVELLKSAKTIPDFRSTLKRKQVNGQLVQYKTGSMSGVFCLSGYIGDSVFSILINAPGASRSQLQMQIDHQLELFCQLTAQAIK